MPKTLTFVQLCATLLALATSPLSWAQKITAAESAYVGEYKRGDRETLSQLAVLDDKTFCFAFMGGSLDMLVGGRWKTNKRGDIELLEVRPDKPRFPAGITQAAGADKMLVIDFHGYTLSEANGPVFGVSATETLPTTLRPLFPEESSSWAESYKLPPIAADQARYIYIGDMGGTNPNGPQGDRGNSGHDRPQRIKVTQYKIENASIIRVGFDTTQARPIMSMTGQLADGTLRLDGEMFGRKMPIRPGVVEEAHASCIDPALNPDKPRPKKSADEEDERGEEIKLLKPMKTFYLDVKAIKGAPYFEKKRLRATSAASASSAKQRPQVKA